MCVRSRPLQASGFTLIELMIVVVVIAILAAIAIPAYNSYMVRGRLGEAFSGLGDLRLRQEQYYADNRSYGTAGSPCPSALPSSQYFDFTCTVGNPNTSFSATATSRAGVGLGNAGDYVYTLAVSSNGAVIKSTTMFAGAAVTVNDWKSR